MMPDLGSYAGAVLGAYGVTFLVLAGVVVLSVLRSRRVKAELETLERKQARDG